MKKITGITGGELGEKLEKDSIETRRFFYPLHEMPIYSKYAIYSYPIASRISKQGLSLPSSVKLSEEDIKYIVQKIKENIF